MLELMELTEVVLEVVLELMVVVLLNFLDKNVYGKNAESAEQKRRNASLISGAVLRSLDSSPSAAKP